MSKGHALLINDIEDYIKGIDRMKKTLGIIKDRTYREDYTTAKRLVDEEFESRFGLYSKLKGCKRKIRNHNLNAEGYLDAMYNLNLSMDHNVNILNCLMNVGFAIDNLNYLRQNTQEMII